MPSYRGREEAEIDATPEECFGALTDYERLHEWQRAVKCARIVDTGPEGDLVEYEVDAKVTTIRYSLRQTYDEPYLIDSTYVSGPFRDMSGRWTFEPTGDGRTRAAVEIEADPGRWLPGPIKKAVQSALLGRAIEDLRERVER